MIKSGLTGVDEASSTFIAQTRTGVLGLHLNRAPSPGVEAGEGKGGGVSQVRLVRTIRGS